MHDVQEALRLWVTATVNWNMTDTYSLCRTCANFHSWKCPASKECFDQPKKPYYKAKECKGPTLL